MKSKPINMKTLQDRIDTIREEFQDARPDVALLIDELVRKIKELESDVTIFKNLARRYREGNDE